MMYSSPYYHMPFFYGKYAQKHLFTQGKMARKKETLITDASIARSQKADTLNKNSQEKSATIATTPPEKEHSQKENRSCEDKPIFEIFGIKLYFDDLLIIGLLLFLYSEEVQDQELFLALILLLFS